MPTKEPTKEPTEARPTVYGDNAYGAGEFHSRLGEAGIESRCKTQAPTAAGGLFSKDRFAIDLDAQTVRCPAGNTAPIRAARTGGGTACFGPICQSCPLRAQCTTATAGRTITVGAHEQALADARTRQTDPAWIADYRSTRPKIERKLGHLMRRRHGGRRARVRGTQRVDAEPPGCPPTGSPRDRRCGRARQARRPRPGAVHRARPQERRRRRDLGCRGRAKRRPATHRHR